MHEFTPALQAELVGRMLIAVVLGSVLGWERQMGRHPAGLRTHMLVSLGAAAYTIAGIYGVAAVFGSGFGSVQDPGRVAAQIITGIGFLGAGTIWRSSGEENVIRGLTTAASIWVAAAIGMLTGYGMYVLAAGTAVISFVVLRVIRQVERAPRVIGSAMAGRLRRPRTSVAYQPARYPAVVEAQPTVPVPDGETGSADTTTETLEAEEAVVEGVGKRDRLHKKLKKPKKGRKRKQRDLPHEDLDQISDEDEPVRASR